MWSLKSLVQYIFETDPEAAPAAPPPVAFQRYDRFPALYTFNREKLDINLLKYPDSGRNAHRDAVLLLVYGCEEILKLDEVNEAYICRKLGETRDRARSTDRHSFEAVYFDTASFSAQDITDACVKGGLLERLSVEAGGSLRLAAYARDHVEDMAYDMNMRA